MTRDRIFRLIFAFGGAALLIGLGVWQVQRLAWKNALIAQAEAQLSAPPVDIETLRGLPPEDLNFRSARLTGAAMPSREITMLHSQRPQGVGFRYLTPFRLEDGAVMLVDRGFVPKDPEEPVAVPPPPEGVVTIEGKLRRFFDRGALTPENDPARNIWFAHDLDEMADYIGAPLALEAVLVQTDPPEGRWPMRTKVNADMRNFHLPYAITWFSMAALWLLLSWVWLRRKPG